MKRSSPNTSWLASVLALAVSLTAVHSSAEPGTGFVSTQSSAEPGTGLVLDWQTPSECPTAEWVEGEVERLVGMARREVHARCVVTRDPSSERFLVSIELSGDAQGGRTLSADSCASAARAAALIISLSIDPQAASVLSEQIEQSTTPASQAVGPAAPAKAVHPPSPATERSGEGSVSAALESERHGMRGLAFAGMVGERAVVPGLGVGTQVGGGVETRALRADLALSVVPSASASVPGEPRWGARFTAGSATARVCPALVQGSLEFFVCGVGRAVRVWSKGTGVPESYLRHVDLVTLGLGGLVRWPGGTAWAAELGLELDVPLNRPEFRIENAGPVYQPDTVGGSGSLSLAYRF